MSTPTIRIYNCETQELVDREMNDEEFSQYKKDEIKAREEAEKLVQVESKKVEVASKLSALGLTLDDLKALGL